MTSSIAAVFPGQGSQSVGMLVELAAAHDAVRRTFDEASVVLGYDLWQLVQDGPAEALNRTDRTQPAMLAADVAVWRVWRESGGPLPAVMAGHSLGEYAALVCADSLDFGRAVTLVAERGRFMQEAVPSGQGAMAAVLGLDDEQVRAVCAAAAGGEVVAAVNFNSPGQVVIAGNAAAVERAIDLAKEAGAKRAIPLPVSVPSHCELMRPAAQRMAELLETTEFAAPRVPVLHNADVRSWPDAAAIRDALVRQLYSPVRWTESVTALGTRTMIEFGPGKVLSGLAKRIDRDIVAVCVQDSASLDEALTIAHGGA